MMNADEIEKRLRVALGKPGVVRSELARRTGISEAMLCRFLAGGRRLGLYRAVDLADALGLELRLVEKAPRRRGGEKGA